MFKGSVQAALPGKFSSESVTGKYCFLRRYSLEVLGCWPKPGCWGLDLNDHREQRMGSTMGENLSICWCLSPTPAVGTLALTLDQSHIPSPACLSYLQAQFFLESGGHLRYNKVMFFTDRISSSPNITLPYTCMVWQSSFHYCVTL